MKAKQWTCQRQIGGLRCGGINQPRTRKCHTCGKPRPPRRRPKHLAGRNLPYEAFVEINSGDVCFLCGKTPEENGRALCRDHDHATGEPRGLLCWRCNKFLHRWMTPQWLRKAAYYIERNA